MGPKKPDGWLIGILYEWNFLENKTLRKYRGLRWARYILHPTFGGHNEVAPENVVHSRRPKSLAPEIVP